MEESILVKTITRDLLCRERDPNTKFSRLKISEWEGKEIEEEKEAHESIF